MPFIILDCGIARKEVQNHLFHHPAFNHASQALTSEVMHQVLVANSSFYLSKLIKFIFLFIYILGMVVCRILTAIVTGIVLGATGLKPSVGFGINIFFSIVCADAMTMWISYISPDLISTICTISNYIHSSTSMCWYSEQLENPHVMYLILLVFSQWLWDSSSLEGGTPSIQQVAVSLFIHSSSKSSKTYMTHLPQNYTPFMTYRFCLLMYNE
jgi:hypothetical protein